MLEAWRIVKKKHATTAFTGKGASDYGGRWNSRGVAVIYTSSTKSLAALEILVHLNPPVTFEFAALSVKMDSALIEHYPANKLPADWHIEPPALFSQTIGDQWVKESRSTVLALPSVIVRDELNYLINPAHPDFKKLIISAPQPFAFDPRLL